jgi:predicted O-methyltransferase YrrM
MEGEKQMSDYKFTQDWFKWAPPVWEQLVPMLSERKNFLEIGSFEGRSAIWIVENMMEDGGEIFCIDTWEGGEDHINNELDGAQERFNSNIELLKAKYPKRKVIAHKGTSTHCLASAITAELNFDFIYIDGSHTAPDTLTDACMSFPLLKVGGFMVFDDYMWGDPRDALHRPKIAIDSFCTIFAESIEFTHLGYQLIIRKTK